MATQEQIESMRMLEKKMFEAESSIKQHYERYLKQSRFTLKLGVRRAFNILLEFFFYGWAFWGLVIWVILFMDLLSIEIARAEQDTTALEDTYAIVNCLINGPNGRLTLYLVVIFLLLSVLGSLFTAILLTRYRRRRTATRRLAMMTDSVATEMRFHFQEMNAIRMRLAQTFSQSPTPPVPPVPPAPPKP